MKKLLFILVFILITPVISYSAKYVVGYQGYTFKPAELNINIGDTVNFELSSYHNAVEVSQSTFEANGNTYNGGFDVPYGGGAVVFNTPGTYYYVCTPHAMYGMKGTIHVTGPASSNSNDETIGGFVLSPNPTSGYFNLFLSVDVNTDYRVFIMDINGKVFSDYDGEYLTPGLYHRTYQLNNSMNPGLYLVTLVGNDKFITRKLIVH